MQLAHKIELKPNNKQKTYFKKACGVSRFVWNWALEHWESEYKQGNKPNALNLKKTFNSIKKEQCPFVLEVTKYVAQQPFIQLQVAFNRYFKGLSKKPKFKKKKSNKDSFYIGGDQIKVDGKRVRIPRLGWVRIREQLRFDGRILSATISRKADRWYIAFAIEVEKNPYSHCENQARVGVDLGIEKLATLSNGRAFENLKTLKRYEKHLTKLQRQLSKKQHPAKKGDKTQFSNNYIKQKRKVEKLHQKIANTRKDYLHKLTTFLTENYKEITIEDLNVSGMLKNHHLAKAISDVGMYEFKRQLEYKSQLRGNNLIIVDRWFPSSKTCSNCGYINHNLKLSDRTFKCPQCGLVIDRDLNASINLLNYSRASSARIYACGEGNGGIASQEAVSRPSLKQELSTYLSMSRYD